MLTRKHTIPVYGLHKPSEGMYRTFLSDARMVNPNVRLIGLTATPYRMTTGMICGPENLLNHVCYEVGVRELIVQGFDAPNIDCVALLRPTNSPGLYYQMVGRGFRLDPTKDNCLVLDFGGNILRHGPVDALEIKDRAAGTGEAPAKECPQCQAVIHAAYSLCPECGYEFPPPKREQHDHEASTA